MPPDTRNKHIILMKSAGLCAFINCSKNLVVDEPDERSAIIGDFAHIKGENPGSARFDKNMSKDDRNSHTNIIYLCKNHHKIIDDQQSLYTVEKLHEMKNAHESWIKERIMRDVSQVTFAELEVVTKYLISNTTEDDDISVICPDEKLEKNQLSSEVRNLVISGLSRAKLVEEYLESVIDPKFPERLKNGFVDKYNELVSEGLLKGDDLFDAIFSFSSGTTLDFKKKAAGLVVLVYFFEKCDIFEK